MRDVLVDNKQVEVVDGFCYFGDGVRGEGGAEAAVRTRISSAWRSWRELANKPEYPSSNLSSNILSMCATGVAVWIRDLVHNETTGKSVKLECVDTWQNSGGKIESQTRKLRGVDWRV